MLVTLELEKSEEYAVATLGIRDYDNDEYTFITCCFNVYEVIIKSDITNVPSRPNGKWVILKYKTNSNQFKCILIDKIYNNSDLIIKDDRR